MQPAGACAEVRWVRARVSKHCAKDYCIGMSWGFCGDVQSGLLMGTVRGTYGTGLALAAHTHNSSTQLCHTQLFHTQLCHMHLFHTQSFTQLCHVQLFHTTLLHTQTYTHNTVTHSSFTQPVLHHVLSLSCLPRLIFTSDWALLEEIDMWGVPVF